MKPMNCPNCGAALPSHAARMEISTCEFCRTSFRAAKTLTPEADMGDLLLGADFRSAVMPGWEVVNPDRISFHDGSLPEMRGFFKAYTNSYYLLKSSGLWNDFDVSVNIKFTGGDKEYIRAGVFARFGSDGGYGFLVSAQGTYAFGAFEKDDKGELGYQKIMTWSYHTSLREGFDANNRLRVICNGEAFRVYLNGVAAASFSDKRFSVGKLYLAAEPGEKSDIGVAFSDLQLREVPPKG